MTSRAAASRYARALFDVILAEGGDPRTASTALGEFGGLMAGHEGLARTLTHPAIPAARKRAIVEELLARSGRVPGPVARLLVLLADRDRLGLLPEVAGALERRLLDHLKVVRAEVTTAVALPDDRVDALRQGLAGATGREVHLETRVDPSILGGAVARIGSTVYDGSVTRQLSRLRETLTRAAD